MKTKSWFIGLLRLYDVGSQRSQRRKWLKCFEGIQALWFVAALSSYDTTLMEASPMVRMKRPLPPHPNWLHIVIRLSFPRQNRLQESLDLFASTCATGIFRRTSMVSRCPRLWETGTFV